MAYLQNLPEDDIEGWEDTAFYLCPKGDFPSDIKPEITSSVGHSDDPTNGKKIQSLISIMFYSITPKISISNQTFLTLKTESLKSLEIV